MAGIDKVTRILLMYTKLIEGGKIYKNEFCAEMNIDRRTFDRDVEDIRLFLSETYQGDELIYDRNDESYHLRIGRSYKLLSGMELTFLMEILKGSGALRKDEYTELISNLLATGERNHKELVRKIAERNKRLYKEGIQKAILKQQWDLQQCIEENEMITLHLQDGMKETVSPVAVWEFEGQFYLFAFVQDELEIFLFHDIESFRIGRKKFDRKLIEKFDALGYREINRRLEEFANEKNKIPTGNGRGKAGKGTG